MSKKSNPALIGGFVLGGLALLIGFILIIAGDSLFKNETRYVIYFDGSIYGLNVGSNVMFRGVPVGYVSDIEVLADFDSQEFAVPVYINIISENIKSMNSSKQESPVTLDGDIQPLIDLGLRASLSSESMITGKLYINLDFSPQTPIVLRAVNDETPEIPSIPSGIQEVIDGAQRFVADIQANLDIPKVMADVTSAIDGLDKLINNPASQDVTTELNKTFASVRVAADSLGNVAADVGKDIDPVFESLAKALAEAEKVLETAESKLQNDSDLTYRIGATLQEIEAAARAVRNLADQLEEQPESIVKGKQ